MAYLPQFENDIYISYASVDNLHWIDVFHKHLDAEFSRVIGRLGAIKIWRNIRGQNQFDGTIQSAIEESAIFLALTSRSYFSSDSCLKELKIFHDTAESTYGVKVGNRSRIFPVYLQSVPTSSWPLEIVKHGVLGHPFYDEYDVGHPSDPKGETFQTQIRLLARDIIRTLQLLRDVSPKENPPATNEFMKPTGSAIFISYRRGESTVYAGRLYDQLAAHFGENRVFMDLDTIEPGDDFVEVITNYVSSCSILIALINRAWLDAKDDEGRRRLLNPDDFVNLEISIALQRKIRVIPVLVQGASMPRSKDLPESLAILSRRNALELSDTRWKSDVSKLITVLKKHL